MKKAAALHLILCLLVVSTLLGQSEGKGGGRGGGGRGFGGRSFGGRRRGGSVYVFGGGSGAGGDDTSKGIKTFFGVLVVFIVVCQLIWWIITHLQDDNEYKKHTPKTVPRKDLYGPFVVCYLCRVKVQEDRWKDGTHRRQCAYRWSEQLNLLRTPFNVMCPHCHEKLREWPRGVDNFFCKGYNCLRRGPIPNVGANRFNCFRCNYDLCLSCVIRVIPPPESHQVPRFVVSSPPTSDDEDGTLTTTTTETAQIHTPPPDYEQVQNAFDSKMTAPPTYKDAVKELGQLV